MDCADRTVAGAVAAFFDFAVVNKAEFVVYVGRTYLPLGLFLSGYLQDGACRADLGTLYALGTAVASLERHFGLHQVLEAS